MQLIAMNSSPLFNCLKIATTSTLLPRAVRDFTRCYDKWQTRVSFLGWCLVAILENILICQCACHPPTIQEPANAELFILDPTVTFQDIVGFGGSFTDATGININSLTTDAKKNLLRSYFSETGWKYNNHLIIFAIFGWFEWQTFLLSFDEYMLGIEYNLCRVPIGGSDFSPRGYTYNDGHNGDFELNHFQLQPEDLNYKIPLILEAQNISCHPMKLLASPWSPPVWMKTNDALNGTGQLRGEPGGIYYKTWAKYLIRSVIVTFQFLIKRSPTKCSVSPFFANTNLLLALLSFVRTSCIDFICVQRSSQSLPDDP